ncbi:MAG: DUF5011 domain-containing protein [Bacilli bacterium]|nr:DUF5011 domain-containing protein [Bacilli bacterium]
MRTKRILMSILLLLVTFSLVACGKVTVKVSGDTQVKVGQTIKLTPEASKSGATFTWASSNDAVATVKDGSVTGVSAGKVTITVTASKGKKTGEASIEVTVIADNAPVISGADDVQILKGERFVPLQGVTARDEEDGDLTDQIQYDGNVNFNLVGEYIATYTVRDSAGNVTTVTRKVTVVSNDTDAPLLTGTSAKTIIIGDTQFKLTDNVSANDAIDGDVTANIKITGEVDVWKLGEYSVKYEVSDAAGNKAEATRVITVGLGEFQFEDLAAKEFAKVEADYQFAVALESINTQLSAFALAKLTFKVNAAAACELVPSITNGTAQAKIALAAGDNDVTVYFRVNSAILEGAVKLAAPADASLTFSDVKFAFAEAKDVIAPVINVPEGKMVLPVELLANAAALKPLVLAGVTASDNVDGPVNAGLDVDLSGIAAGATGEQQVVIYVVDSSNNRGEATRTVEFAKAYSTNLITDPTFSTDSTYAEGTTDPIWEGFRLHGGAGDPEMYTRDGVLVHHNRSNENPGYDSASCPIIDTDSTVLQAENWYMLKFDVKAAVARNMSVRIGLAADAPVWLENFEGASNYMLSVSTDWETKYVVFYVHSDKSANGYSGISCELKNGGAFTWNAAEEVGNTFYFDNLQFYLLSNENAAPTLTINKDLPTTFGKGQDKPDLTQYVTAHDREDAADIQITAAHITENVDMSKAGTYDVVYKVADSEGKEATITLQIKVLEEADTTAPVLAEVDGLVKVFDQFSAAPDITKFITATDDVDGVITITTDMIQHNANLNVVGTYDIVYTVKDSSGNSATLTVTITVNDKEAPKVEGKALKTYVGTPLTAADIIANLTVTDNVDGAMTLTEANVKGLDQVKFNEAGEYKVVIEISDAAGNKAEVEIAISVREKGNTKLVADQVVIDLAPDAIANAEACTITEADGEYTIALASVGGWASANKVKYSGLELVEGESYVLKIVAKADQARQLQFNLGIGLWADPWMDAFTIAEDYSKLVKIGTEYAEYTVLFTYDKHSTAGADSGPTLEFCVGPTGDAGDVAGNNIYFKEFAIYSTKEIGDVNLLNATIDPQHHEASYGLVVSKTGGGQWDWVGLTVEDDLTGYNKVVADVIGPDGKPFVLKVNDSIEVTANGNGGINHVEWTAPADFAWDAAKKTMIMFPDFNVVGEGNEFAIVKLELQGEGKEPINLLAGALTKCDPCAAKKMVILTKPASNSEPWDCAKFQVSDDLSGYAAVKYAVIGTAGDSIIIKPNDNGGYEKALTLTGSLQEGIISLTGMAYNNAKSAVIFFVNPNATGSGNPVYVLALSYLVTKPEQGQSGDEDLVKVEASKYILGNGYYNTTDSTRYNQLISGDTTSQKFVATKTFTKEELPVGSVIKIADGYQYRPEGWIDENKQASRENNTSDERVEITEEWWGNYIKRGFNISKKDGSLLVEGTEAYDAAVAAFEILVPKGSPLTIPDYVPVYPEAVEDSVDLLEGTINPKTIQVAHQIRMMKTGGGQWDWVGLKTNADLTGYTKMVAEVTGPAGAPFVIKVNDQVEVPANGTGAAVQVEWNAAENFAWNAEKQTMIIFPDFNKAGESNEFTVTKLELQGEGKDPIDLLLAPITLSNQYVQACRDLVLTKAADNAEPWDCIEIALPVDLTGATEVKYVVRGTKGEVLCIKPNNNGSAEKWISMDGKAISGSIDFSSFTYDASKPAMVVFPNISETGSGHPFYISQLVYVKPEAPVLTGVKMGGNAEGALTLNEATGIYEGTFALATSWQRATFTLEFADETKKVLTYDNAKVIGSAVLEAKAGATWSNVLYSEDDAAERGEFILSADGETHYSVAYNPATNTLSIDFAVPAVPATIKAVKYAGAKQGEFALVDGKYEALVDLGAWNRISFVVVGEDDSEVALWYTNAKFAGAITAAEKTGDAWDKSLYHESADGNRWMPGQALKYKLVYDPATNTMTVAIDKTAPVVTVADSVATALAAANLTEGQDASALFGQLLAGISANDDFDGAIAVTQEMVDLGGLTLNQLIAGDYKVTVKVKDAAGNEGKAELQVHVAPYPYTKHSLNVSGMQAATLEEDTQFADFFTVLATADKTVVVEANSKNAGSLSFTKRMKLGGKSAPTARAIKFTTKSSSVKVTVYVYSSNSETRTLHIFDADKNVITSKQVYGSGELTILEYVITTPGTYFIGGMDAAVNIYDVVVEEGYTIPAAPANVNLFADHPGSDGAYNSTKWTRENYKNDKWNVITGQMNARTKDGVKVVNMVNGYSVPMRFTYNKDGEVLGLANKLSFKVGNYFSGAQDFSVKVKLVLANGSEVFIAGDANNWVTIPVTQGLIDQELTFDAAEVKSVVFVTRSSISGSTYLYVGNCVLSYDKGTQANPLTVEEALDLAARMGRSSSSAYVDVQEVWIKGYVVNAGEDKGTYVQNAKIASTLNGKPLLAIYTASKGTGIENVYVNDEVLVHAYLMNYGGTLQIATTKVDGESLYSVIDACKAGTSTVSVSQDSSEHATVKEISAESGVNGSTFTFKVDVANGHELVGVKVNGVDVEAVEGVYTATIGGPTQIVVETKEEGAVEPEKVADFSFASASTGTMSTKTADKLEWVQGDVTFIANKDNSSTTCNSNSGEPYVNPIRVYAKQSIEVHYNGLIKVVFNANSNDYATALKNSTFPEGATVTVNAKVVTVVFAAPVDSFKVSNLSAQVRINSFEVYALPNGQASSPAAFQLTNLQAEGDARNHIEGAGAWIWIDPTSIGLTAENMAQFSATATCESINVVGTLFSNYSASAVRCYVTLASAPAADATTTINLTITNGDASYQGTVSFLGNELQ